MPYLDPPPFPAPVVVYKDVGGFVNEYRAATARYRAENREVQLHECRSACTLALSLPNVCVYPTSLLKFHKAYNPNTNVTDEGVSQELFSAYPAPIQARLGGLSRSYRVLTGAELIALGVRNCAEGRTMIARRPDGGRTQVAAAQKPSVSPPLPDAGASVGSVFQTVLAAVAQPFSGPAPSPSAPAALARGFVDRPAAFAAEVPLPPRRPRDLLPEEDAAPPTAVAEAADAAGLPEPGLSRLMTGAQPILPTGTFVRVAWAVADGGLDRSEARGRR